MTSSEYINKTDLPHHQLSLVMFLSSTSGFTNVRSLQRFTSSLSLNASVRSSKKASIRKRREKFSLNFLLTNLCHSLIWKLMETCLIAIFDASVIAASETSEINYAATKWSVSPI